jgi:hypothetical protein
MTMIINIHPYVYVYIYIFTTIIHDALMSLFEARLRRRFDRQSGRWKSNERRLSRRQSLDILEASDILLVHRKTIGKP